ncbi:hypothetical protein D3C86_2013090 [compost metagenome]
MIGEWLNENTITGIASHRVCSNADGSGSVVAVVRMPPFQCGIRNTARNSSATMNGYTIRLMALTISCSPQRTTASRPRISTSDSTARGGGMMCS